nr:MAG TPA: hypothetical protein [Caudoviricetes sp.]
MKATVVNNVENTTRVVEIPENVTTVSSLKRFLQVSSGRIFEGVTHTDLDNDNNHLPVLPEEKKERGYVFFVSPAQNKTKNGAYSRAECYSIIKSKGLADEVKRRFGRNFTQVPTAELISIIEGCNNNSTPSTHNNTTVHTAPRVETGVDASVGNVTEKDLLKAIVDAACPQEKKELLNRMINKVFPNPYSVQDLDNMRK